MPKSLDDLFITPEGFEESIKKKLLSGPNGWLLFVACSSARDFARKVKKDYEDMLQKKGSGLREVPYINKSALDKEEDITIRFEDSETCIRLPDGEEGHVAGSNVYAFQCVHEKMTKREVNANLWELYELIRTLKEGRAKTITAVLPYHPYSRQDKPTFTKREAISAKLNADLLIKSGINEVLTYHLHTESIRGFYEPDAHVVPLTGLDLFIDIFSEFKGKGDVVAVSPDAGGTKFVLKFSEMMDLEHAIMNKYRYRKDDSSLLGVVGALDEKKKALITDDETVTGTSLINAGKALKEKYNFDEIHIAISHFKIKEDRTQQFIDANQKGYITTLHVTDSIPQPQSILDLPFIKTHTISRRFAAAINRLHYNQSVKAILYRK